MQTQEPGIIKRSATTKRFEVLSWASVSTFTTGLMLLFFFSLGASVDPDHGYGVFAFLAIPGLLLLTVGFLTQWMAIKEDRKKPHSAQSESESE